MLIQNHTTWTKHCPKCGKLNVCASENELNNKIYNMYSCTKCGKEYKALRDNDFRHCVIIVESLKTGKRYNGVRQGVDFLLEIEGILKRCKSKGFTELNTYAYQIKYKGKVKASFDEKDLKLFKQLISKGYSIFLKGKDITSLYGSRG